MADADELAQAAGDARVTNQKGELPALFRGKCATVKGAWIE